MTPSEWNTVGEHVIRVVEGLVWIPWAVRWFRHLDRRAATLEAILKVSPTPSPSFSAFASAVEEITKPGRAPEKAKP